VAEGKINQILVAIRILLWMPDHFSGFFIITRQHIPKSVLPPVEFILINARYRAHSASAGGLSDALTAVLLSHCCLSSCLLVVLRVGVNSFHAYMSNEGHSMLRDSELYRLFRQCKQLNALPLVHAENGILVEEVCRYLQIEAHSSLSAHTARTGQSRFARAFSCPISPTNATAPLAPDRVANQV